MAVAVDPRESKFRLMILLGRFNLEVTTNSELKLRCNEPAHTGEFLATIPVGGIIFDVSVREIVLKAEEHWRTLHEEE